MMAFRPHDTNNINIPNDAEPEQLSCSPPTKKCDKSPSKVSMFGDMLYRPTNEDSRNSSFKFSLTSIPDSVASDQQPLKVAPTEDIQSGGLAQSIDSYEKTFSDQKALLLNKLEDISGAEERKQMVDMFLEDMNRKTLGILRNQQEFAQINANKYYASYTSPSKSNSPIKKYRSPCKNSQNSPAKFPQKENSPLKKMGELRKHSRQVQKTLKNKMFSPDKLSQH